MLAAGFTTPCRADTRVSLDSIVECFNDGMSAETIRAEFDTLTLAQVYGVIAYYLHNQPAIDAYRIRQELKFAAIRIAAEPLPEAMQRRIQAVREQLGARQADL